MRFLIILIAFLPSLVLADIESEFAAIKNNGRSLVDIGAVCEEVAQHQMKIKYPSDRYNVLTSIAYSDLDGTVGELDLIIFEKSIDQAVIVGEVKCWKDMSAGLRKAHDQRSRFLRNINSGKTLSFSWLPDPLAYHLTKKQFNKINTFITIAQKGSRAEGFDVEMDLTLAELMDLRARVMACQSSGSCKKPGHH